MMTDNEIIKALECCGDERGNGCSRCPIYEMGRENDFCTEDLYLLALDLINRQKAENEALIAGQETLQKYIAEQKAEIESLAKRYEMSNAEREANVKGFTAEIERLQELLDSKCDRCIERDKAEATKEFAEKIDELLKRYSHLHKRADEVRRSTEEYADGTPMEMVSVWEVLSLKKWEMVDYENMNTLQDNIETIAIERLLTEIEKDFKLLEKEMTADK